MDQATITMIENLRKNTGKSLEEWIAIVQTQNLEKHGQVVNYLKSEHGMTHGFANLVAHKAKGSDAGSVEDKNELIEKQYKGKEHFVPLYQRLINEINGFGKDVEIAPKNTYVSLRRKKQFATIGPATKTRFEIGLNLKGQGSAGKLQEITKANSMCSHKIDLEGEQSLDQEVLDWIRKAYEQAG